MIATLLIFILLNSLFINGIYIITRSGMIFGFIENLYDEFIQVKLDEYLLTKDPDLHSSEIKKHIEDVNSFWWNPLFGCITCMSSVWSAIDLIVFQALFKPFAWDYKLTFIWGIIAVSCSFLNTLIFKLNDRL